MRKCWIAVVLCAWVLWHTEETTERPEKRQILIAIYPQQELGFFSGGIFRQTGYDKCVADAQKEAQRRYATIVEDKKYLSALPGGAYRVDRGFIGEGVGFRLTHIYRCYPDTMRPE